MLSKKEQQPLISCQNVTMGYEGVAVLSNLTFNVESGDYLCIVGENGSGKTTLIKGLLGLAQPQSGWITTPGLKKNHVGYLPQQNQIQRNFPASVYEIVLSGCLNGSGLLPFYTKKQKQQAQQNMQKCGIEDIKNKCYRELSGGQQQRVLLARALCAAQSLLILDEPVTGLDPIAAGEMYDIISKLNRQGLTVIMISHDVTAAVNRAGKILHLEKDGTFFGTAHRYVHSDLGSRFLFSGCRCDNCIIMGSSRKGEFADGMNMNTTNHNQTPQAKQNGVKAFDNMVQNSGEMQGGFAKTSNKSLNKAKDGGQEDGNQ
jgi:zinc transport system ATP-binding protein